MCFVCCSWRHPRLPAPADTGVTGVYVLSSLFAACCGYVCGVLQLAAPTPYGCLHLLTQVRRVCLCRACLSWLRAVGYVCDACPAPAGLGVSFVCVSVCVLFVSGAAAYGLHWTQTAHVIWLPAPADLRVRLCLCSVCQK
jgi:hypothetical protein